MALPSAVSIGSGVFIVAAAVGLVAITSNADEAPSTDATRTAHTRTVQPKTPHKPVAKPVVKPKHHKPKAKPEKRDVVPKVFVEVYNNSGITGLAADKAAQLQGAGWNVAATDNWYGSIPESTVYYPSKLEGEAKQLAKLLHVTRLRPAVSPMQFDRLTVIFTSA